jgi:hypothetical protein
VGLKSLWQQGQILRSSMMGSSMMPSRSFVKPFFAGEPKKAKISRRASRKSEAQQQQQQQQKKNLKP